MWVPEWSRRRFVLAHHTLQSCDPSGFFHVPHPPLSSTPSAAPSDKAHLLVWPPYRFLWPPTRSLCSSRRFAVETPHWCPLSTQMVQLVQGLRKTMVWFFSCRKERRYPELSGMAGRSRRAMVKLALIRSLAWFKPRSEPPLLRKRVEQAWRLRWWSLLSCGRVPGGADGTFPLACEVEGEV